MNNWEKNAKVVTKFDDVHIVVVIAKCAQYRLTLYLLLLLLILTTVGVIGRFHFLRSHKPLQWAGLSEMGGGSSDWSTGSFLWDGHVGRFVIGRRPPVNSWSPAACWKWEEPKHNRPTISTYSLSGWTQTEWLNVNKLIWASGRNGNTQKRYLIDNRNETLL